MPPAGQVSTPGAPSWPAALAFWWKLGWISFGGPAGQIALMHREIVERRRWLSEDHFLHALNFCMLLPGPEAQQLATYLGWRLHGARGGIAAGALFVLPSLAILIALSWLYMAGGQLAWIQGAFHGLAAAVIAIVLGAVRRIGARALRSPALWLLALAAFIAIFVFKISFVFILLTAGAIGGLGGRRFPRQFPASAATPAPAADGGPASASAAALILPPPPRATLRRALRIAALGLALWWTPVLVAGLLSGWQGIHFQQGLFFSKTALITVGGAYAVLPYVAQTAVSHYGWLSQSQMMAGLGLAETTPGPLIMVLPFVGFVAAWQHPGDLPPALAATLAALITTWVTFLPCFLFVFLGGPHVESLRTRPALASAMTAITAAVVGVILNLAVWLAWHAIHPAPGVIDGFTLVVAAGCWLALERFKTGVLPTLAVCALAGVLWQLI